MVEGFLKGIVDNAEKLGTFSAAAVWAFFTLVLIAYIFFDMRAKKQAAALAWQARLKEAEADILMANAVSKLADEVRYKISLGSTHV